MANGSEHLVDEKGQVLLINETDVPDGDVMTALGTQYPELRTLQAWSSNITSGSARHGSLFERDRFVSPDSIFEEMKTAIHAAEYDDTVSGVLETTEALAFSKMSIDCDDPDEEDIWNQVMADIDMDNLLRRMWRELFTVSQFYAVTRWKKKKYRVRSHQGINREEKRARRKTYTITVPDGVTILDPLRIVPVGNFAFGEELLAYIANRDEVTRFDEVLAGDNTSDIYVKNLLVGKYTPTADEKQKIKKITEANVDNLYLLNPDNVWRHTDTRPDYQRFATIRMKSVFELLDLKQQLRSMDRAYLIGGTNFIILVKKGSENQPAKPNEIQALAQQVRTGAKVPVMVGDHRLDIQIVTPKMDMTLKPERYNGLDSRIAARLYLMFMTGNYAAGTRGDDSIKLARVVARGIESRRHMMRRTIHEELIKKTLEKNDSLSSDPKIVFHPRHVALDFDNNLAQFYNDLRRDGNISRDTLLSEFDINQDEEARKRMREEQEYGDVFDPPAVAYGGDLEDDDDGDDGRVDPKVEGRNRGGNRNGGGENPESRRGNDALPPNNSPSRRRDRQRDRNRREDS